MLTNILLVNAYARRALRPTPLSAINLADPLLVESVAASDASAGTREQPRLDISASGLATRHQSPEMESHDHSDAWPLRWQPARGDSAVQVAQLEDASPDRMLE